MTTEPETAALGVRGDVIERTAAVLLSKPTLAVVSLLALIAIAHWLPGLDRLRLLDPPPSTAAAEQVMMVVTDQEGEAEIGMATKARRDLAQPEKVAMPTTSRGPIARVGDRDDVALPKIDAEKPPISIVGAKRALDRFFGALSKTAVKEPSAITRILYYGDSVVASDFGTGTLRRKLQAQFGDAGHGFVLVANAWPAYFHNDLYRIASRGWKVSRIVGPYVKDGAYGLGGVSFTAPPGLRARVGTAKEGTFGRRASRFTVAYMKQPHGGELKVSIDGEAQGVIDTSSSTPEPGFETYEVPEGEHLFEVVTAKGMTRLFGFTVERDTPGVVLDAVGVVGARLRFLDKQDDEHWKRQLAWRRPNLVVYQFGANESGDGFAYSMEDYHRTMREVLDKVGGFAPQAGCLVVGAMDRARKEDTRLVTVPVIPLIVEEQKKVAAEAGCAFFDTFTAMGGRGSMAKWVARGYGAGDFTHPTNVGAEVIGNWVFRALVERWEEYRTRQR